MRLADYVVKFLEQKKISTVFTVSGGGSIFLCDALYKAKKLKYVSCHHEQAVAYATEGYARAINKPGAAIVTTGPGGTNTASGIACCWIDSVPVIFISGQVFLNQTIGNSGIRQIGVQEFDIVTMVKSSTKYSVIIKKPEEIKFHLEKAYHLCLSGRPGPVWIDIPANIQNAFINEKKLKGFKINNRSKSNKILDKKIKTTAKALLSHDRPLLHLGRGVKLSNCEKIFKKFIKKFHIPFALTWNADDFLESNHSLYIGRPGAFGSRGANFIVQNCNLYISIGTRLPYMVTGYDSKDFARHAKKKIMVDIDKRELNKKNMKIDLKIACDARYFLEKLYKYMKNFKKNSYWINYCQKLKSKYPIVINSMKDQNKYVNSYYFVDKLSEVLNTKDTIITDMGFSFTSAHQAFKVKKGQTFHTNSGHAPMGWGLPAAVGAFHAQNDIKKKKRIICLTGDGGFQLNIQELATIMHHKIPIKIFVFNNAGYLTIKQTQELGFNGRIMGADKESLSFPNYKKLALTYKMNYFKAKSNKDLKKILKMVINSHGASICELIMDPDEEQIPKAINKRTADGKSVPTKYEDMYPFLPPAEILENMLL